MVTNADSDILIKVSLGDTNDRIFFLQNVSDILVEDTQFTLNLTCVNRAGYSSDSMTVGFSISSLAPVSTGKFSRYCRQFKKNDFKYNILMIYKYMNKQRFLISLQCVMYGQLGYRPVLKCRASPISGKIW